METSCPPDLLEAIGDRRWHKVEAGESGCAVWRLVAQDGETLYLKVARGRFVADLVDEHARLVWFAAHVAVPEVRAFVREAGAAWMLTTAMPGRTGDALLEAGEIDACTLATRVGRFLRRLHALPVADCPFDARLPVRLSAARANIDAGLVPEDEFDEAREGWSAEQVWTALNALRPLDLEEVATHGDYSLGNILLDGSGEPTGCIDLGRAGIADPYQDLAVMWNNLGDHGPDAQGAFLSAYGLTALDPARLQAHLLLDELF